tara:strand:- start:404 stop:940 length:537 start_codon:yes stop_codon:yes gene_type:complete
MNKVLKIFILLIFFSCSNKKESSVVDNQNINNNQNIKYWSNDVEELDLVMSYILSDYKDYKRSTKKNKEEKIKFLDNYFIKLDPDTTTVINESLEELNKRVLKSKKLFSDSDLGLLSDRAKIYIIYGPPKREYQTYKDNLEVFIWQYEIDDKIVEFHFIDDNFGRYKLIMNEFNHINY